MLYNIRCTVYRSNNRSSINSSRSSASSRSSSAVVLVVAFPCYISAVIDLFRCLAGRPQCCVFRLCGFGLFQRARKRTGMSPTAGIRGAAAGTCLSRRSASFSHCYLRPAFYSPPPSRNLELGPRSRLFFFLPPPHYGMFLKLMRVSIFDGANNVEPFPDGESLVLLV